jgi:glycerophosphoryl diester phosphodiesterase
VGLKPHPRFAQQEKRAAAKPLLSDLFVAVKKYCAENNAAIPQFNIETKCLPIGDNVYHPAPEKFVDLVMAVVKEQDMERYINLQSFDYRTLQYAKKKYAHIPLAALVEDTDKNDFFAQEKKLGFKPDIYSPHYSLVTKELVYHCNNLGVKLIPWTVNDKAKIMELKKMGVHGIITDYPNLFDE